MSSTVLYPKNCELIVNLSSQEMKAQGVTEDRLLLLKGVSGVFRPGVLTALMGVSGAGKTTLMDVLAGRKTGGYIEGTITISGYPKKQETFARISGYCEQNDIHSPHVTVYESLVYSAWLRLPPEVDSSARKVGNAITLQPTALIVASCSMYNMHRSSFPGHLSIYISVFLFQKEKGECQNVIQHSRKNIFYIISSDDI